MAEDAIKIFFSYSRKDLDMRNTLEDHLSALRVAGKISTWHDLELEAGTEWEPEILNKLDTADIILLLVSSDFIASKYCYVTELKRAIARHNAGTARVIPIILRPCFWNIPEVPFSKLNVLPTHAKPIKSWADPEEAFAIVAQKIWETVDQLNSKKLAERQAEERQIQQLLVQQEAEAQAEQERQRQAERLQQQEAEAAERQQELERQRVLEQQRREETQRQQAAQTVSTNELASEREVDYTQLRDLLKAGKWREADRETADRMCEVIGRQEEGWLRVEDIEKFPCTDLRTIDQLWVKYSKGRFGFSVQKQIWQKYGSPTKYNSQWEKFGEEVGWKKKGFLGVVNNDWKKYSELTLDIQAPEGHLPGIKVEEGRVIGLIVEVVGRGFLGMGWKGWLFSRATTCKL